MFAIDTSDRWEQRKFGIGMAGAIAALGFVRWGIHWMRQGEQPPLPVWFLVVAAVFLAFGLAWPRGLKPVFVFWMKLALALNFLMTHIMLSLAFFVLFVPGSLILRMLGKDPLNRRWDAEAATYWETAEDQPDDFERYLDQF